MTKSRTNADNAAADILGVTAGTGISGGGTSGTPTVSIDTATTVDKTTAQTLTNKTLTSPVLTTPSISTITTKGDLLGFDTALNRVPIGTNNQVLTADSAQALGLKWATASAPAKSFSIINSGGTALTGAATITVSSISGMDTLMIIVDGCSSASASPSIFVRFNTDSTTKYNGYGLRSVQTLTYNPLGFIGNSATARTGILAITSLGNDAADVGYFGVMVQGCNSAGLKVFQTIGGASPVTSSGYNNLYTGYYSGTAVITSVSIFSDTGNFDAGTVYVYGSA